MKNLFYYLLWLWNKTDKTDFAFSIAITSIVVGLVVAGIGFQGLSAILVISGVLLMFGIVVKIFVIDPIKSSYNKYKREQTETFNRLKKNYR